MAVGAASPTAQGQAMTMTARANMNEKRAGPARIDRGQPAGAFEKRRDALVDVDVDVEASVAKCLRSFSPTYQLNREPKRRRKHEEGGMDRAGALSCKKKQQASQDRASMYPPLI